jgi:hypothetical protein
MWAITGAGIREFEEAPGRMVTGAHNHRWHGERAPPHRPRLDWR